MGSKYRRITRIVLGETDTYFKFEVSEGNGRHFKNNSRSPRGIEKGKSSNDDENGHGPEKRRPMTLCKAGKNKNNSPNHLAPTPVIPKQFCGNLVSMCG